MKDLRPQLLRANKKIRQLQGELRKLKNCSTLSVKKTVKQYLTKRGHNSTCIKHIINPKASYRRNYDQEDVSLGLVLKNLSHKGKHNFFTDKLLGEGTFFNIMREGVQRGGGNETI